MNTYNRSKPLFNVLFKIQAQEFAPCSMKLLIGYNIFLPDLDSIRNKLLYNYSLNICFLWRFHYTDGQLLSS